MGRCPVARVTKFLNEHVVQANYGFGHGWEDIGAHEYRTYAVNEMRTYQREMPEYAYRVIHRRVPNPAYAATLPQRSL